MFSAATVSTWHSEHVARSVQCICSFKNTRLKRAIIVRSM